MGKIIVTTLVSTMILIVCSGANYTKVEEPLERVVETTQEVETVEFTQIEPITVVEQIVEPIVEPPKPFYYLTDEERSIVERIVMGESGGESYEGQVLVAQCLLNASLKDGIQPSEVRTKYKYAGWNNNPSESVKRAVSAVFDDGFKITEEPILYFYSPKNCYSGFHESQVFVVEVGGHRFFKEHKDWR